VKSYTVQRFLPAQAAQWNAFIVRANKVDFCVIFQSSTGISAQQLARLISVKTPNN
jgi:hypothetical protein